MLMMYVGARLGVSSGQLELAYVRLPSAGFRIFSKGGDMSDYTAATGSLHCIRLW